MTEDDHQQSTSSGREQSKTGLCQMIKILLLAASHFFARPFVRNVAAMAGGTAAAQAIALLFMPIVTRLYGPEAFGVQGLFLSLVSLLGPVATLTYPIAVILPEEESEAKGLARLSICIAFFMSLLIAGLLIFLSDAVLSLLKIEALGGFIFMLPLAVLFTAFCQVTTQWLIRTEQFRSLALIAAVQALIVNLGRTALGIFQPVAASLVTVTAIGTGLHAAMLWAAGRKASRLSRAPRKSRSTWAHLARRHADFPLFRMPQTVFNSASQGMPVLALGALFGPASAGLYALARSVLQLPISLVGNAVGSVLYPKYAQAYRNGRPLAPIVLRSTLAIGGLGLLPFGAVALAGPTLFGIVFGQEWREGGEFARWMSFWWFCGFLNRPSVAVIPVLGLQGWFLVYEVLSTALRVASIGLGYLLFSDPVATVIVFSLVAGALNITLIAGVLFFTANSVQSR